MTIEQAAAAYARFYEDLTPDTIARLRAICTPDVRFRDPFNDVTGIDSYVAVLEKMFEDIAEPRFRVVDKALSGRVCYLRWDFSFRLKRGGAPWRFEGMSEVHFDEAGLVAAHLDHWDSGGQFYARLPVLGWLIRQVRRRLAVE